MTRLTGAGAIVVLLGIGPHLRADADSALAPMERQKAVKVETDQLVRSILTTLRVLEYYQIEMTAREKLLEDLAVRLGNLSQGQMNEVLDHLDAAVRVTDKGKAEKELLEAYTRHRQVTNALKDIMEKHDAVNTLEQLIGRLRRTATQQTELHGQTGKLVEYLRARQRPGLTAAEKQRLAGQFPHLGLEQRRQGDAEYDLFRDLQNLLKLAQSLKSKLPPEHLARLVQMENLVEKHRLPSIFYEVFSRLNPVAPDKSWYEAHAMQGQLTKHLQELVRVLDDAPDPGADLREARARIDQSIAKQEKLLADTAEHAAARAAGIAQKKAEIEKAAIAQPPPEQQSPAALPRTAKNPMTLNDPHQALEQMAIRLDKAAQDQRELADQTGKLVDNLGAREKAGLSVETKRQLDEEVPSVSKEQRRQGDAQYEILRELKKVLNEAAALKKTLGDDPKERVEKMEGLADEHQVMTNLYKTVGKLNPVTPLKSWREANDVQKQLAGQLQDLAKALHPPKEALAQARKTQKPAPRKEAKQQPDLKAAEKNAATAKEAAAKNSDLGKRQAELGAEVESTQRILQPLDNTAAAKAKAAAQAMKASAADLAGASPEKAQAAQQQALEDLREAKKATDKLLAAPANEVQDPLAALQKAATAVDRLIQEQGAVRAETGQAKSPASFPALAQKQDQLTGRTEQLLAEPAAALKASDNMDRAAQDMAQAARDLAQAKPAQAAARQDNALTALAKARDEMAEQTATIRKRRADISRLDALAKKLDELAAQEGAIAADAESRSKTPSQAGVEALATDQRRLTEQAREVQQELQPILPQASSKTEEAVEHMETAGNQIAESRWKPAAEQAQDAVQALLAAKKLVENALQNMKSAEKSSEIALQSAKANPLAAALLVSQAQEQTRVAAGEASSGRLSKAQQAAKAAMAALGQAQAQAPKAVQGLLQQASQELAQANENLQDKKAEAAASHMGKAQQCMHGALAALGEAKGSPSLEANSSSQQGAAKTPGKKSAGQQVSSANAQSKSSGNAMAGSPSGAGKSQLHDASGDGSFISSAPRQRDMVRQALSGQVPPEYAAMIQQFYVNLARGRPATLPATNGQTR